MMKYKFLFLLVFTIICEYSSLAQSTQNVKGSCIVRIESDMSMNEAKKLALDCAKKNALENAFGTKIIQNQIARTESKSENKIITSVSTYNEISNSEVNGEWIETTEEPTYKKTVGENGDEFIECSVKGKARPLKKIAINFEAFPLAKENNVKSKTYRFNNDQDLYFYFKSGKQGYLTIYLDDYTNVYQLLPYKLTPLENFPVKADQEYFFFQKTGSANDDQIVDELTLVTDKQTEQNTIIVLFSPKPFDKPILNTGDPKDKNDAPKSLPSKKFIEYIQKLIKTNDLLEKSEIVITIDGA